MTPSVPKIRGITVSYDSDEDFNATAFMAIFVRFEGEISHEFGEFMQGHMEKHGKHSEYVAPEWEVSKAHPDTDLLLIELTVGSTEYRYFEEYFEDQKFLKFMEDAINIYETQETLDAF